MNIFVCQGSDYPSSDVSRRFCSSCWIFHPNLVHHSRTKVEILIPKIRIYTQDIGLEFGIEKYDLLIKSEKIQTTDGIELPHHERIRTFGEKGNYWYPRFLEADTIKQAEIEEKSKRSSSEEGEKRALLQKSYQRDKHRGTSPCKVLWRIPNVAREKLRQMDQWLYTKSSAREITKTNYMSTHQHWQLCRCISKKTRRRY